MKPARGRRAALGVADQLLYSLSNFVLTVLVARSVSPSEFGAYALIVAAYLIAIAVIRGFSSETLVVRFSAADVSEWRPAARAACGAAAGIGVLAGLLLVATAFARPGTFRVTAIVFGIFMPILAFQDSLRFAALSRGRPQLALINDAVSALVEFGAAGALIVLGHSTVPSLVAAWGAGALAGAVIGAAMLKIAPRPLLTTRWLRQQWDLASRYAADDLASQGSQQVIAYVVAGVAGLPAAGALRGAQTVFAPTTIVFNGVQAAVTPEFVRVVQQSSRQLRRYVGICAALLGLLGLLWGIAALASPPSVGHFLFGRTWAETRPLLVYFVIAQTVVGIRVAPMVGLRALGAAGSTLLARGIGITLGLIFSIIGAVLDGATGVAIATAIVTPLQGAGWWWQFEFALRRHMREKQRVYHEQKWNRLVSAQPVASGGAARLDAIFLGPDDTAGMQ